MRNLMRDLTRAVIAVFCFVCVSVAQMERASIVGTVTDNSGAVLPGVHLKIANEGATTVSNVTTDSAAYSALKLTPGSYSVEAEKAGFTRHINRGFVLQVSQEARLDIQLGIGAVEQTIEMTGATPLLQTEGSSVGQVIDAQPIDTLPLNGRNFAQLAAAGRIAARRNHALANGARDSSNQLCSTASIIRR